jgi:hypothetical protein
MICPECKNDFPEFVDFYGLPMIDGEVFILGEIYMCYECGIVFYYDIHKHETSKEIPEYLRGYDESDDEQINDFQNLYSQETY